jgi:hypothetical protein
VIALHCSRQRDIVERGLGCSHLKHQQHCFQYNTTVSGEVVCKAGDIGLEDRPMQAALHYMLGISFAMPGKTVFVIRFTIEQIEISYADPTEIVFAA